MSDPYRPIEDYAIIGDCACAALVSKGGSIDWLCWPSFDGPAFFWRLIDAQRGGFFSITPTGTYTVTRRYVDATNILETSFEVPSGRLLLTGLMYAAHEDQYEENLLAEHQILRKLECLQGEVEVELTYLPRPNFGRSSWRCELGDRGYRRRTDDFPCPKRSAVFGIGIIGSVGYGTRPSRFAPSSS